MPNINDFKIIGKKSEKYFDLLANELGIIPLTFDSKKKEKIGFYLYMLENISGVKDIIDLAELVTDTEFNTLIFDDKSEDYGIDAVQINEDEHSINLFNFKYRDKFKPFRQQKFNEAIISTKFINALISENTSHLKGKIKKQAKSILDKLINSKETWALNLFVVSNDSVELDKTSGDLQQVEKAYGLEVIPIGLSQITQIMSIRPKPINAELIVSNDAIMSFAESTMSSSKSYVMRLPVSEVIRITCNDKELRHKYNLEDIKPLQDVDLDYSVLFDNVRGFVTKSKYNPNISRTLEKESARFFMYNNGLTLTAQDIEAIDANAKKQIKLTIKSFQVLNGGQTLRTIHAFNRLSKKNIGEYLTNSEVLVRVFKTINDKGLNSRIAEYTNSQNSISSMDLKSLRTEQIQLEQYLDEYNIIYSRKTGDTGISDTKEYAHKISMEKFGQILFSINGYPEKATNQKKKIFDKYYNDVFGKDNLIIEKSPEQILLYFQIKQEYKNKYTSSDQKIFYILYLVNRLSKNIPELIDIFENLINKYVPDSGDDISPARKLIHSKFKQFLDIELNIVPKC